MVVGGEVVEAVVLAKAARTVLECFLCPKSDTQLQVPRHPASSASPNPTLEVASQLGRAALSDGVPAFFFSTATEIPELNGGGTINQFNDKYYAVPI
jgi:hypothetical protein